MGCGTGRFNSSLRRGSVSFKWRGLRRGCLAENSNAGVQRSCSIVVHTPMGKGRLQRPLLQNISVGKRVSPSATEVLQPLHLTICCISTSQWCSVQGRNRHIRKLAPSECCFFLLFPPTASYAMTPFLGYVLSVDESLQSEKTCSSRFKNTQIQASALGSGNPFSLLHFGIGSGDLLAMSVCYVASWSTSALKKKSRHALQSPVVFTSWNKFLVILSQHLMKT